MTARQQCSSLGRVVFVLAAKVVARYCGGRSGRSDRRRANLMNENRRSHPVEYLARLDERMDVGTRSRNDHGRLDIFWPVRFSARSAVRKVLPDLLHVRRHAED